MFFRCLPIALTKERTDHEGAKYHDRGRPNTVIVRLHAIVFFVYICRIIHGELRRMTIFPHQSLRKRHAQREQATSKRTEDHDEASTQKLFIH